MRFRRGMTFIELLLGLIITSILGGALAAVSLAVASGWEQSQPGQSLSLTAEQAALRLGRPVREACALGVLRGGAGMTPAAVILWRGDAAEPDILRLDEIVLLEHNRADSTLYQYRVEWPANWSTSQKSAANVIIDPAALSNANAPEDFKKVSYVVGRALARHVSGLKFSLASGAGSRPRLTYSLTMQNGDDSYTVDGTIVLRAARPGGG